MVETHPSGRISSPLVANRSEIAIRLEHIVAEAVTGILTPEA